MGGMMQNAGPLVLPAKPCAGGRGRREGDGGFPSFANVGRPSPPGRGDGDLPSFVSVGRPFVEFNARPLASCHCSQTVKTLVSDRLRNNNPETMQSAGKHIAIRVATI